MSDQAPHRLDAGKTEGSGPPGAAGRGPLGTVSIRVRVIAAVMAVLAVVLLVLSFSVQSVFAAQSDRSLDALLTGRAQLARQLARDGVRPQQIVNRVAVDGVVVSLELRDGTVLGTPVAPGSGVQTTITRLSGPGRVDAAQLTLSVNSSLATGARQSLQRILLVGGLAAVGLSAGLVAVAVRLALRPLDSMAALAQDIAGGARGRRLAPTRTGTEIGRTARALDEMLDELEGAEAQARAAEAHALRAEERLRAFLADAAHELRTPLSGVRAAAETLLHHGSTLSAEDHDQLEALLVREAQRAGRLVDDLLAMARLDVGPVLELVPVDLDQLLAEEVARARLLSPTLTITRTATHPVVDADLTALRGALRNVVDNARRAAAPGGTVDVTTG
ncbi:MAG: histidine kinase dimerization/phospho-acceptor domain-containing protein, partial [Janthinobacterium lividum]